MKGVCKRVCAYLAPTETSPTNPYMPFINLRDTPIRLPAGQLRIGRGRGVEIALPAAPSHAGKAADALKGNRGPGEIPSREGQFALLVVDPSGSATLSKLSDDAPVYLNSVPAGLEPTPLLHGDRVEVDGVELRFSDDRQGGQTGEFPVLTPEQATILPLSGAQVTDSGGANRAPRGHSARPGCPVKNGRLVSLMDGREYAVCDDGLSIGRDAGCDVVVPANSVSRRHARIALEIKGYTITDSSTNGVVVSGERIRSSRLLRRGDIVRVGPEEFRFYQEEVEAEPTPAVEAPPIRIETSSPAPAKPKAPVLATLVVANSGPNQGDVYEITSLLTHIGRGEHNDIILAEDSVSDSHAKIQRRDNRWILIDLDSTNGTYVDGSRLTGETELQGDVDVRFGGAKLVFKPARLVKTPSGGTRVVAAFKKKAAAPNDVADVERDEPKAVAEADGSDESKRSLAILWAALLGVLALTLSVILRALW